MVIIRGPVEFRMGSPHTEADRNVDETQHRRRIGWSFAIASTPVTVAQFLDGIDNAELVEQWRGMTRSPDCPLPAVSWYQAAFLCNFLSLPREFLCPSCVIDRILPAGPEKGTVTECGPHRTS